MSFEIHCGAEPFKTALERVLPACEARATLPILGHILLKADGASVALTACNLELEMHAIADAEIKTPGAITLPGKKLHDIVRAWPSGQDLKIKAAAERATISNQRHGRYTLAMLMAADFPRMDQRAGESCQELLVPEHQLKRIVGKVLYAAAVNDVRYYMNGVHLCTRDGQLLATGSDGHRLARAWCDLATPTDAPVSIIIPRATAVIASKLMAENDEPISLTITGRSMRVDLPGVSLSGKLIEGRYPDIDRVIPAKNKHRAIIHGQAFADSANRAVVLSNEKYRGMRCTFQYGELHIDTANESNEGAHEQIEIIYEGPEIKIGYNHKYLIDIITQMDGETLHADLLDSDSPTLFTDPARADSLHVLMPMRL